MEGENVLSSVVGSLINRNRDDFNGCNGGWLFILLFIMMLGGGGFWGANRLGNTATTQDVAVSSMYNQLDNDIRSVQRSVSDNGYATLDQFGKTNMAIQGTGANLSKAISESIFVTKDVGCGINRNIDGVKFDVTRNIDMLRTDTALQTCKVNEHADQNHREVLAAITDLKMSGKDEIIADLRTQLAGANQTLAQGQQTTRLLEEQARNMQMLINALRQPNCGCGTGYGFGTTIV